MFQLKSIFKGPQGSDYISSVVSSPSKPISELSNNTLENFIQFCCFIFTIVQQSYTVVTNKN